MLHSSSRKQESGAICIISAELDQLQLYWQGWRKYHQQQKRICTVEALQIIDYTKRNWVEPMSCYTMIGIWKFYKIHRRFRSFLHQIDGKLFHSCPHAFLSSTQAIGDDDQHRWRWWLMEWAKSKMLKGTGLHRWLCPCIRRHDSARVHVKY